MGEERQQQAAAFLHGGMNTDCHPRVQKENTYRFALNGVLEDIGGNQSVLSSEMGDRFIADLKCDFVIGHCQMGNAEVCIFLGYNEGQGDIIVFNAATRTYRKYVEGVAFKFDRLHPLTAIYRMRRDGSRNVYWTDGVNPVRFVDFDNLERHRTNGEFIPSKFELFGTLHLNRGVNGLLTVTPEVTESGGSMKSGSYTVLFRMLDEFKNPTNWIYETKPVIVYRDNFKVGDFYSVMGSISPDRKEFSNGKTNKSIRVWVNNLDDNYRYYQLGLVCRTELSKFPDVPNTIDSVYLSPIVDSAIKMFEFISTDTLESLSVEEVQQDRPTIGTAEALTQMDGRLFLGNVKGYNSSSIDISKCQRFASRIRSEVAIASNRIYGKEAGKYSKSPNDAIASMGYMPGETYVFGIRYFLSDGNWTPVFHIPCSSTLSDSDSVAMPNGSTFTGKVNGCEYDEEFTLCNFHVTENVTMTYRWTDDARGMEYWGEDCQGRQLYGAHPRFHRFPSRFELRDVDERFGNPAVWTAEEWLSNPEIHVHPLYPIFSNIAYPEFPGSDISIIGHQIVRMERGENASVIDSALLLPMHTNSDTKMVSVGNPTLGMWADETESPEMESAWQEYLDIKRANHLIPDRYYLSRAFCKDFFNRPLYSHGVGVFAPIYNFTDKEPNFSTIERATRYSMVHGRYTHFAQRNVFDGSTANADKNDFMDNDGVELYVQCREANVSPSAVHSKEHQRYSVKSSVKLAPYSTDVENSSVSKGLICFNVSTDNMYRVAWLQDGQVSKDDFNPVEVGYLVNQKKNPYQTFLEERYVPASSLTDATRFVCGGGDVTICALRHVNSNYINLLDGMRSTAKAISSSRLKKGLAWLGFSIASALTAVAWVFAPPLGAALTSVLAGTAVAIAGMGIAMLNAGIKQEASISALIDALENKGLRFNQNDIGIYRGLLFGCDSRIDTRLEQDRVCYKPWNPLGYTYRQRRMKALGQLGAKSGAIFCNESDTADEAFSPFIRSKCLRGNGKAVVFFDEYMEPQRPREYFSLPLALDSRNVDTVYPKDSDDKVEWLGCAINSIFFESPINVDLRFNMEGFPVKALVPFQSIDLGVEDEMDRKAFFYDYPYTGEPVVDPDSDDWSVVESNRMEATLQGKSWRKGVNEVEARVGSPFHQLMLNKLTVVTPDDSRTRVYLRAAVCEWYRLHSAYTAPMPLKYSYPLGYGYVGATGDGRSSENFPLRVYYSEPSFTESLQDGYRNIRPNSYRDLEGYTGPIRYLFTLKDKLYIQTEHGIWMQPNSKQERVANDIVTYLGDGAMFTLPPILIGESEMPRGGTSYPQGNLLLQDGLVTVSTSDKKVYLFTGEQLVPISDIGMSKWFLRNLSSLPTEGKNAPQSPDGHGFITAFDNVTNRIILTMNGVGGNGWTLSFSMTANCWDSFHSYVPSRYIMADNGFFTVYGGNLYQHCGNFNSRERLPKSCTFHGATHDFYIEAVLSAAEESNWNAVRYHATTSGKLEEWNLLKRLERPLKTFSHVYMRNDHQMTCVKRIQIYDRLEENPNGYLERQTVPIENVVIADRSEDDWVINGFRNELGVAERDMALVESDYPNRLNVLVKGSADWFDSDTFRGRYLIVTFALKAESNDDDTIRLFSIMADTNKSDR